MQNQDISTHKYDLGSYPYFSHLEVLEFLNVSDFIVELQDLDHFLSVANPDLLNETALQSLSEDRTRMIGELLIYLRILRDGHRPCKATT